MTREEAIQALNEIFDDSEFSRYEAWYGTAMKMAIEALQAEGKMTRCKDCEYLPEYVKQVARACGSNIRAERREP